MVFDALYRFVRTPAGRLRCSRSTGGFSRFDYMRRRGRSLAGSVRKRSWRGGAAWIFYVSGNPVCVMKPFRVRFAYGVTEAGEVLIFKFCRACVDVFVSVDFSMSKAVLSLTPSELSLEVANMRERLRPEEAAEYD